VRPSRGSPSTGLGFSSPSPAGSALYQLLTLGDDDDEEWDDVELEQLGCCPNCEAKIRTTYRAKWNTAYDEAVRKCPECDAVLGAVGTTV